MTLFLLLSCGSGSAKAEDPQSRFLKSLISLSNDFLDVFTSFGEMISGTLGFKADSKKADVGKYFTRIADTMTSVKEKLQDKVAKNDNYPKIKEVVDHFITNTLDKIAAGAKIAGEAIGSDNNPIANVADQNAGTAGEESSVKSLSEGIGKIVDVVLKEGDAEAGTDKKADGLGDRTENNAAAGEAGKLFAANADSDANAKKSAADAAKAVGAVTGADILQAIVKNNGDAVKLAKNNDGNVIGKPKDGTIAGAIALRAMAKNGKFAGPNNQASVDAKKAVEDAALSAVTKALGTLTIAIRNTVDSGLKSISEALASVKQEDKSADSTTPADATASGQQ
nr:variable large family protein [Borrelia turicatae]